MKIKIREEERKALRDLVEESSQIDVSKKSGVDQSSISHYISERTSSWTEATYHKLLPLFKKYLPSNYQIQNSHIHNSRINQGNTAPDPDLISKSALSKLVRNSDLEAAVKLKILDILDEI